MGVSADTDDVLYQDVRWSRLARWRYGIFLYPLFLLFLVGSITTGVPWHVAFALAFTLPPIAVAELRLRRMASYRERTTSSWFGLSTGRASRGRTSSRS